MLRQATVNRDGTISIPTTGQVWVYTDEDGNIIEGPGAGSSTALPTGVNKSGSITTGGTAKVLAALNASRKSLTIQNTSTGDLFINEHGTATVNGDSFILEPKASANVQTCNAVSVLGMTTGQTWAATETSV